MSSSAKTAQADPFLLELFRTELDNHTRVLDDGLVKAEGEQSPERIEPLMRAAHSIKGAARMLALDLAVRLAHAMEDLLSAAQRGAFRLTAAHIDVLLRGNDVFLELAAASPPEIPQALDKHKELIERLVSELGNPAPLPAPPVATATARVLPAHETRVADDQSVRVFAENLNRLVGLAGECLVKTRLSRGLSFSLHRIRQRQAAATSTLESALEKCRQDVPVMAASALAGCLDRLRDTRELIAQYVNEFGDFSRHLDVLTNRLYGEAVASRMRPFADGVRGYPRMVRDLAKELGKMVRFDIEGESTPVDREILEKLEAPLTHLLRNALDHGIEPTAERVARGKAAEGKLLLSARHVSGMLIIAVTDDGAGVDIDALRQKIVARSYINEQTARELSETELLDFLFLPGFSTARKVTEVSGRGVGLDVVHSMVRSVGGSVRIQSKAGAGTALELQLPLTLSVVRSLLVEIDREPYAIPLTRIDHLLRASQADLQVVESHQFCTLDGDHIGIVSGRQVLQGRPPDVSGADFHVVVISDRLNRYGLVVDRFLGQRDLVVKTLPPKLGNVPNVSACAILEDGRPVLILDVDDLVRSIDNLLTRGDLKKIEPKHHVAPQAGAKRVLVIDDSLTVREVERRLLENRGYEVVVAIDGMDGWNALQNARFDLMITDVDMPRMDGLELVRRVRSAPRLAAVPIVIVSYKEQEEYRRKGMEAGANYYLTKSSFHDESLASAVRDLIGEP